MKDKIDYLEYIIGGIAGIITFIIVLFILGCIRGFVICMLWKWFITPLGIQPIGYAHAFGFSVIIGYILSFLKVEDKKPYWYYIIVYPSIALILGYVAHLIMVSS